jgi:hypothetical protein
VHFERLLSRAHGGRRIGFVVEGAQKAVELPFRACRKPVSAGEPGKRFA